MLFCVDVGSSLKVFYEPSNANTCNGSCGATNQVVRPQTPQMFSPQIVSSLDLKHVLKTPKAPIKTSPRCQSMEL
jgi:hypothetical protein